MNKKQLILDTIDDLVKDFLYYDQKEDEELSVDDMERALGCGVVAIDKMVEQFRKSLTEQIK